MKINSVVNVQTNVKYSSENRNKNRDKNRDKDYVYEECYICHKEMTNVRDIYVTLDTDKYICVRCKVKNNIPAVKCDDL